MIPDFHLPTIHAQHRGDRWTPESPITDVVSWFARCVEATARGYQLAMQIHLPLPTGPESASLARDAVQAALKEWGLKAPVSDLMLVVSELVTNAYRYGCAPVVLHLTVEGDHLIVGVEDSEAAALPVPRQADDFEPTGRGLRLISAMTTHWGWNREHGNKVVWAQLPLAS